MKYTHLMWLASLFLLAALAGCESMGDTRCVKYRTVIVGSGPYKTGPYLKSEEQCQEWVTVKRTKPIVIAVPPGYPPNTIFPGIGIKGCQIGLNLDDACKNLGAPVMGRRGASLATFPAHGVYVSLDKYKTITSIAFILKNFPEHAAATLDSPTFWDNGPFRPFQGMTDRRIKADSRPEDVKRAYGELRRKKYSSWIGSVHTGMSDRVGGKLIYIEYIQDHEINGKSTSTVYSFYLNRQNKWELQRIEIESYRE